MNARDHATLQQPARDDEREDVAVPFDSPLFLALSGCISIVGDGEPEPLFSFRSLDVREDEE